MPEVQTMADRKSVPLPTEGEAVEVEIKEKSQTTTGNTEKVTTPKKEDSIKVETSTGETSEEEVEQYSSTVQKRIDRLTRKMREAERREQAALDYAKGVQSQVDSLEKKQAEFSKTYQTEKAASIKSQLEAAKTKYKTAYEGGDTDKIIEANEELAKLQVAQANINSIPVSSEKPVEKSESKPAEVAPPAKPDPRAEEWANENSWFGKDEAMTYAAFGIHKRVVEVEGFDPKSDEYYAEIDKRMRKEFPHKFEDSAEVVEKTPKRVVKSAVAPANRNVRSGRKTVKLTPSQVAIATKLGVPLEEYAKHVKEA